MEKSASDVKEKIMKLFETEILKYYKPKKIAGTFDDKYVEYKSEGDEK